MFSRYYFSMVSSNCDKLLGQVKKKFLFILVNPQEGCPISWDPVVRSDVSTDTLSSLTSCRIFKAAREISVSYQIHPLDIPYLVYYVWKKDGLAVLLKCLGSSRLKHVNYSCTV